MLTADRCRLPGRASMPTIADHRAAYRRSPGRSPRIDADRDRRSRTNLAALVAMDCRSSVRCPDDCRQAATIPDADRRSMPLAWTRIDSDYRRPSRRLPPTIARTIAAHRCRPPGRISPPWLRWIADRPSVARTIAARPRRFPMPFARMRIDADHRATCRRPSPTIARTIADHQCRPPIDAACPDAHRCRLSPTIAPLAADHRPDDRRASMPTAIVDPGRISPPWLRWMVDRPSVARTIAARIATIPDADRYGLTIAPTLRMIVAHCRSCRKVFAKSVSNSPIDAYPFLSASAERLR